MAWNVKSVEHQNLIEIVFSGVIKPLELHRAHSTARILISTSNIKSFIVNCSLLRDDSLQDVNDLISTYAIHFWQKSIRQALVLPIQYTKSNEVRFNEKFYSNPEFNLKVCHNRDSALDWLENRITVAELDSSLVRVERM